MSEHTRPFSRRAFVGTAAAFGISLCLPPLMPAKAHAVTAAEKQAEANAALEKLNAMQEKLDRAEVSLYAAETERDDAQARMDEAQGRIDSASSRISELQDKLGNRARSMYRSGSSTFLDLLLGATTFQAFASNWDLLNDMNQNDADMVEETKTLRSEVESEKAVYEEQRNVAAQKAEEAEARADLLNHKAAGNLAAAAKETGATLFHVSTDYVFDGTAHTPYTEDVTPSPLGAYGRTKLAGERAVMASGCRYLIFRTAWLYSEYGKNFLKTMLCLSSERERLQVVFDQIGTPTYAGDLALALFSIIEAGRYAGNEGVYHFTNEGVCSWYDFATEIAAAAGHDKCRIIPCHTSEFPTKATRPAYSVLDKTKVKQTFQMDIPHWREAMLYCLEKLR